MNYIVIPFKYKSKDGSMKELSFFITKDQPVYNNFGGVDLKQLVEDYDSGPEPVEKKD